MTWQPIETAPKNGQVVLVAFVEPGNRKKPRKSWSDVAEYRSGGWWQVNDYDGGWINPQPTHWMPLPDPPQETT